MPVKTAALTVAIAFAVIIVDRMWGVSAKMVKTPPAA